MFAFVLQAAAQLGILKGKTIAVDSTTLEANAAMKSLVRRETGEDWKTYIRGLMKEEGIEDPSDEDVRRFGVRLSFIFVTRLSGSVEDIHSLHRRAETEVP